MNTKKITLFILAALVVSLPLLALAQGGGGGGTTLKNIVDNASESLKALSAGLATIAFIVAGIMYLLGAGNPGRLAIAKTALVAAVVGIVIIVLASGAEAFVKTFFKL